MAKPKDTRAPKGSGTCFYSKSRKRFVARKPIGTKIVKGKRKTLYLTRYGKTRAEAIAKRDAAMPPGPQTTVAAWARTWLDACDVREQTRDLYRQSVTLRILPQLGHRRVAEVTAFDVERAAAAWGKEVGANSVRKHLSHTKTMFGAAVRAGLLAQNPVSIARKPRAERVECDPFTAEELARVVVAASACAKTHRLAVMAATGCRIGEAIALLPSDYDARTGMLSITRTRTVKHGVGPTKSANSRRTIRVPAAARAAAAALGPELNHKTAARRWGRLLAGLGLSARGPHQARHSCITHLLAAGVPAADAARFVGDSVETIFRVYCHPTGVDPADAMEAVLGLHKVASPPSGTCKRLQNKPHPRGAR